MFSILSRVGFYYSALLLLLLAGPIAIFTTAFWNNISREPISDKEIIETIFLHQRELNSAAFLLYGNTHFSVQYMQDTYEINHENFADFYKNNKKIHNALTETNISSISYIGWRGCFIFDFHEAHKWIAKYHLKNLYFCPGNRAMITRDDIFYVQDTNAFFKNADINTNYEKTVFKKLGDGWYISHWADNG